MSEKMPLTFVAKSHVFDEEFTCIKITASIGPWREHL